MWINEEAIVDDSVSKAIICENIKQLFEELLKLPGPVKEFFSTKNWFTGLRNMMELHYVVKH